MRSSRRLRLVALVVSVVVALSGAAPVVSVADTVANGPVFTVMHTSETPPDGVWARNSPSTGDTDRVTGHGVYAGEQVQLRCYSWGEAVGEYGNRLWYEVINVSRPVNAGVANEGFLNAHFIDDGLKANEIDAGVPKCGNGAPVPSPGGGIVYYSPYGSGSHLPEVSTSVVSTVPDADWKGGATCDPSNAWEHTPSSIDGKTINTLSGWSLGRAGVLYELKYLSAARSPMLSAIKYVLLIDPGGYEELRGSCDTVVGSYLATWLKAVPDARLVILAGPDTLDAAHPINGYASAGIQNYYFNAIRQADSSGELRSRVLVCNYADKGESIPESHQTIYKNASRLIGDAPLTACPQIDKLSYVGYWNP